MALILDHINGVADDNRLENLRIVCPNCAATLGHALRPREPRRADEERDVPALRRGLPAEASAPALLLPGVRHALRRSAGDRARRTRRVERPPYEQLVAEVAATSWSAVGRKYGVSDNAVRKWVRAYERERA